MALIDDPNAWILRLFDMEEREGRGSECERFPDGCKVEDIPLDDDETILGIYKAKYLFSPKALYIRDSQTSRRLLWADISACSTKHGDGRKWSDLTMSDGTTVRIRVGDFASGWSGRISQLFHQMIDQFGHASFGHPLYSIEDFFAAAKEDECLAPNLYPHPSLTVMQRSLLRLRQQLGVTDVLIHVNEIEDDVPYANEVVIRTNLTDDAFEDTVRLLDADGIQEASENVKRKVAKLKPDEYLWILVWD